MPNDAIYCLVFKMPNNHAYEASFPFILGYFPFSIVTIYLYSNIQSYSFKINHKAELLQEGIFVLMQRRLSSEKVGNQKKISPLLLYQF